jgi:uncharacterized protein (DUF302 family)
MSGPKSCRTSGVHKWSGSAYWVTSEMGRAASFLGKRSACVLSERRCVLLGDHFEKGDSRGEAMLSNQSKIRRSKPAGLIIVGFSLTMLLTGMASALADVAVTQRVLQVEHVTMKTTKKFAEVEAALERNVPQLDPAIAAALANGDEQRATELEQGAPLFIFLKRDHGALLQVTGRPRRALQYEIGNPHTASKMTRHRLPAGLYAPLRVFLYEDETGGSIFEYDRPSSLFGQFGDERVAEVGRYLDAALESVLRNAAE